MVDYITLSELKSHLSDSGLGGGDYDTILGTLITRASRAIDRFTKREEGAYVVSSDVTRYYRGSGTEEQLIDELAALPTTVEIAEAGVVDSMAGSGGNYTTLSASDYFLEPNNALQLGLPFEIIVIDVLNGNFTWWPSYRRAVKITGKFGFSESAPELIKEAVTIQAGKWFKRGQQGFTDLSAMVSLGQMKYNSLDVDVQNLVYHFMKGVV